MLSLWQWFENQFKDAFTSVHGDDLVTWKKALNRHRIKLGALTFAMTIVEQKGDRFPPNLNLFLYYCRTGKTATAAQRPSKTLPVKKATQETWEKNWGEIKAILHSESEQTLKLYDGDHNDFVKMRAMLRLRPVHPSLLDRIRMVQPN